MWKNKISVFLLILLVGILLTNEAMAQTSLSSPYSSFGIGNLSNSTNIRNKSLGGIGVGTRDNYNVNPKNPASYSGFDSTSFIFEGAVSGHYVTLKTDDVNESYSDASLSHLLFGFPVTDFWRSSVGLMPFSMMGYDATDFSYVEDVGNTQYIFNGSGGITQAYWGNSLQPFKFLSLGINTSYLFGTMSEVSKVTFPDSANMLSTLVTNTVSINDTYFDFGAQVHLTMDSIKSIELVLGLTYNPEQAISAKRSGLIRSYHGELSGVPLIRDTINMVVNELGKVVLPSGYGFGFSLSRKSRWLIGADYRFGKWEDFSSFGSPDSLTNSHKFNFGGEITPNPNSFSYVQRIEYRVGGYYNQSYLNLRNEQIKGFGITFGVGLPIRANMIRRTRSMINMGMEIGKRGTLTNGLIQEDFVNFHIGISIYEWWFFKRRYK